MTETREELKRHNETSKIHHFNTSNLMSVKEIGKNARRKLEFDLSKTRLELVLINFTQIKT